MRTTAQVFGGEPDENGNKVRPLHTYTIVDAIHDGNVLPFRIDYINTIKNPERLYDKQVKAIDRENALLDSKRVSEITQYILEHFEQKTYRNSQPRANAAYLSGSSIARLSISLCELGVVLRFFSASAHETNRSTLSSKAISIPFLYWL